MENTQRIHRDVHEMTEATVGWYVNANIPLSPKEAELIISGIPTEQMLDRLQPYVVSKCDCGRSDCLGYIVRDPLHRVMIFASILVAAQANNITPQQQLASLKQSRLAVADRVRELFSQLPNVNLTNETDDSVKIIASLVVIAVENQHPGFLVTQGVEDILPFNMPSSDGFIH